MYASCGCEQERFDESGRGLGLEGRDGGRHGPIGKVCCLLLVFIVEETHIRKERVSCANGCRVMCLILSMCMLS